MQTKTLKTKTPEKKSSIKIKHKKTQILEKNLNISPGGMKQGHFNKRSQRKHKQHSTTQWRRETELQCTTHPLRDIHHRPIYPTKRQEAQYKQELENQTQKTIKKKLTIILKTKTLDKNINSNPKYYRFFQKQTQIIHNRQGLVYQQQDRETHATTQCNKHKKKKEKSMKHSILFLVQEQKFKKKSKKYSTRNNTITAATNKGTEKQSKKRKFPSPKAQPEGKKQTRTYKRRYNLPLQLSERPLRDAQHRPLYWIREEKQQNNISKTQIINKSTKENNINNKDEVICLASDLRNVHNEPWCIINMYKKEHIYTKFGRAQHKQRQSHVLKRWSENQKQKYNRQRQTTTWKLEIPNQDSAQSDIPKIEPQKQKYNNKSKIKVAQKHTRKVNLHCTTHPLRDIHHRPIYPTASQEKQYKHWLENQEQKHNRTMQILNKVTQTNILKTKIPEKQSNTKTKCIETKTLGRNVNISQDSNIDQAREKPREQKEIQKRKKRQQSISTKAKQNNNNNQANKSKLGTNKNKSKLQYQEEKRKYDHMKSSTTFTQKYKGGPRNVTKRRKNKRTCRSTPLTRWLAKGSQRNQQKKRKTTKRRTYPKEKSCHVKTVHSEKRGSNISQTKKTLTQWIESDLPPANHFLILALRAFYCDPKNHKYIINTQQKNALEPPNIIHAPKRYLSIDRHHTDTK